MVEWNKEIETKAKPIDVFTDNTNVLSTSINENENIDISFERILKNLNNVFYKTFKKIRICPNNRITEVDKLMDRRRNKLGLSCAKLSRS